MAVKKQFNSFEEMLAGTDLPVLVDFFAPWCGPCQMMARVLEEVSARMKQHIRVVKINTDTYPELATQHQVNALPTLVLFKNGKAVQRFEGFRPADRLIQELQLFV